jgi:EpsI family protein
MKQWLATVALLALTGIYVQMHPPLDLAVGRGVLAACPTTFGAWNGTELSFADAVREELQADEILIRRYRRDSAIVWLCMVYHQNRRFGAHDPRLCYQSQGYLVHPEGRTKIDDGHSGGLEVNRFTVERQGERRIVYYWWSTAGLSTTDAGQFRGRMALRGALDNRSWGAFIRVEALVTDGGEEAARRAADDFASQVAVTLPRVFAAADGPVGATR